MKTTVIPAQITSMEDKIAANLSFTQIFLLMIPVVWTMVIFMLFVPFMSITLYKLPIILVVGLVCVILALRIKDKIVLDWLMLFTRFSTRPGYYVFQKHDTYLRIVDVPAGEKKKEAHLQPVPAPAQSVRRVSVLELVKLNKLMRRRKYRLSFRPTKEGDIHVAVQ